MDLTVGGKCFHNAWKNFLVVFVNHEVSIFVLDYIKQMDFLPCNPTKKSIKEIAWGLTYSLTRCKHFYLIHELLSQNTSCFF